MMQKAKYLALALALTGALSGCGGGGSGSGSPGTFDEFYGAWKYSVTSCSRESSAWAGGRYYSNSFGVSTLTATSFESKTIYFSDDKCTTKAGATTGTGTLQWSQGSATGRSNVARLAITLTGFTANKDGDGTGITLSAVPPTGEVHKRLLDVADGKLCFGGDTKTADKDGYPTVIDDTDCLTR